MNAMKKAFSKNGSGGFTIVELLIVIVVIGILAALVLNSFAQAQVKARNAQTVNALEAYKKALVSYATEKGSYPLDTDGQVYLGEDYDINSDGTKGDCKPGLGANATVAGRLKAYMGSTLPMPNPKPLSWNNAGGDLRSGAVLINDPVFTLDGSTWRWWLEYYLEGTDGPKCSFGQVATLNVYPNFLSASPATGYSEKRNAGTACWTPLPDPAKL